MSLKLLADTLEVVAKELKAVDATNSYGDLVERIYTLAGDIKVVTEEMIQSASGAKSNKVVQLKSLLSGTRDNQVISPMTRGLEFMNLFNAEGPEVPLVATAIMRVACKITVSSEIRETAGVMLKIIRDSDNAVAEIRDRN